MIDQFIGFVLLSLGIRFQPMPQGDVQGITTEASASQKLKHIEDAKLLRATDPATLAKQKKNIEIYQRENKSKLEAEMGVNRQKMLTEFKKERDAYKEGIKTIKDAKKKSIVESVDTKLSSLNKTKTDALLTKITTASEILSKASVKAGLSASPEITNAISLAEGAVTAAKTAVLTQAGKDYVISVSTDSATLKTNVHTAITQLESDIKAVSDLVNTAKKQIQSVLTLVYGASTESAK
jgi:hypothetical protein